MPHVFISYKREDRSFVTELEKKIRETGLDVWTDQHIRPGENWELSIDEGLKNAFVVVVVITPASRSSEYVTYEWSFAMGMGIPILPIMIVQTEFHPKLHRIQYLDFTVRYGEPWSELLKRVQDLLSSYVPPRNRRAVDDAVSDLVAELKSDMVEAQSAAALALGQMQNSSAVPDLVLALSSSNERVRESAAIALGMIGDNSAIPYLFKSIYARNEEPEVRLAAISALSNFKDENLPQKIGSLLISQDNFKSNIIISLSHSIQKNSSSSIDMKIQREIMKYINENITIFRETSRSLEIEIDKFKKVRSDDVRFSEEIPESLLIAADDMLFAYNREQFIAELEMMQPCFSDLSPYFEELLYKFKKYMEHSADALNSYFELKKRIK